MFQSKVFKRMFFSYLLIIAVSMVVYSAFLLYQSRQASQSQTARENDLLLREAAAAIDERLDAAEDVARDLRYSTAMRDLYYAARLGNPLDSYSDYAVQTELRSLLTAHGEALYGISIFLGGSDRVYSSGGVAYLHDPFLSPQADFPLVCFGSIADTLELKDNKRYYFAKEGLLYLDSYTYQNGVSIGVCCIFLDAQEMERELSRILEEGRGLRVLYRGEEIYAFGKMGGAAVLTQTSSAAEDVQYELYGSAPYKAGQHIVLYGMLLLLVLISLFFVWLAYWESKRYYQPIGYLEQMVAPEAGDAGDKPDEDEMDGIIGGIRALIGEKNRYREKMLTIGPYAGSGMLQSIVTGREGSERLSILSDEDFLDLKRPYFLVSVVNFACEGNRPVDGELRGRLDGILRQTAQTWETEELHIAWYFRDIYHVYLIVNCDVPELPDDLFFGLHRQLSAALAPDHILVSMGVDRVRDDIAELKDACEGALTALDGVLRDGRGEIFFAEEQLPARVDYYFPAGFREQLRGAIERRDREGIHRLLFDIYKKNLDLDAPPEAYRALVDEFYLTMMKTLREISGLATVHLNIQRTSGLMTLQEIFDYYDAALMSVIDLAIEHEDERGEDDRLDEEILSFVDAQFCDEGLSLQMLSDRFNVSNKYLLLLFKQRYGCTYLQYLQNKRITRAAEMIRGRERSLAEIGPLVGYPNQLTFRRNFKAVMGVNPSEYAVSQ